MNSPAPGDGIIEGKKHSQPLWNRYTQCIALGAFLLLIVLSLLHLHGFSISGWHYIIDDSQPTELLCGHAQGDRSDDAVAVVPQLLAQVAHIPPYPIRNTNIGAGTCNMRVNYSMPIIDWTTVFKPHVWGYFVSANFGLAWHWWFNLIGSWLVLFLIISLFGGNNYIPAACGAIAIVFSAFFQFWSLNCAPSTIVFGTTLLSFAALHRARSAIGVIGALACVIWSTTALLFTFSFMPYLVTLLYLALFAGMGFALDSNKSGARKQTALKWVGLTTAIGLAVCLMIVFVHQNWEAIHAVSTSTYPGKRFSVGGEGKLPLLFRGLFLTWAHPVDWSRFAPNKCEAASFVLFFPLAAGLLIWRWFRLKARPSGLQIALLAFLLLLGIWILFGFPAWLAKITAMSRVTVPRTTLAFGIADALLFFSVLGNHFKDRARRHMRDPALWFLLAGWIFLVACEGLALRRLDGSYRFAHLFAAGAITSALGAACIFIPRWFAPAFAVACIAANISFNPLARGGADFIANNALSKEIKSIDARMRLEQKSSVWITYTAERYDIHYANLFRMLGVRALDGVHPYPQNRLWNKIDPAHEFRPAWNRYAHVRFALPQDPNIFSIDVLQADLILVQLHPLNARFKTLGITHVMLIGDSAQLDSVPNLHRIASFLGKHLYEVIDATPSH